MSDEQRRLSDEDSMYLAEAILSLAASLLPRMSDDARCRVFSEIKSGYCGSCGCDDPRCPCWNDE